MKNGGLIKRRNVISKFKSIYLFFACLFGVFFWGGVVAVNVALKHIRSYHDGACL